MSSRFSDYDVQITFTGKATMGKSTVAEMVHKYLKSQGINCELIDHDHPDGNDMELEKRVEIVKRKGGTFLVLGANLAMKYCGNQVQMTQNTEPAP